MALSAEETGVEIGATQDAEGLPPHEVELTDVAAGKVRSLLEQEGRTDLRLRVAVQPGGPQGLGTVTLPHGGCAAVDRKSVV